MDKGKKRKEQEMGKREAKAEEAGRSGRYHLRLVPGDKLEWKVCTEGKLVIGACENKRDAEGMIERREKADRYGSPAGKE